MHKPASTHFSLIEPIRQRWSPVIFDEKPIEAEKIGSLFEAARWAASSFNDQPWSYIVATKAQPDVYKQLLSCLTDSNQVWAQKADLLAVAVAKLTSTRTSKPNRHAQHDVGQANAYLVLQATALGLASHQMGGFSPDRARELFNIPEGYEPLTMLAIGYPGDLQSAAPDLQSRDNSERTRRPLADWVYTGTWGTASSLIEQ